MSVQSNPFYIKNRNVGFAWEDLPLALNSLVLQAPSFEGFHLAFLEGLQPQPSMLSDAIVFVTFRSLTLLKIIHSSCVQCFFTCYSTEHKLHKGTTCHLLTMCP